jgi:hypothetical protein
VNQIGGGLGGGTEAQGRRADHRQIAGGSLDAEGEARKNGPGPGPMAHSSNHQEWLLFNYTGYRHVPLKALGRFKHNRGH